MTEDYADRKPEDRYLLVSTHDYLSTACEHELHAECRKTCKFCGNACGCACHDAGQHVWTRELPPHG